MRKSKSFCVPKSASFFNMTKLFSIKLLSEELSAPETTFIYRNKININMREPSLIAITIISKLVATRYKKTFLFIVEDSK